MDMKFGDKTVVEACLGVDISAKVIEVRSSCIEFGPIQSLAMSNAQELLLLETDRFLIVYDENALRLHGQYLKGLAVYASASALPPPRERRRVGRFQRRPHTPTGACAGRVAGLSRP
jgi:hypothetical protein